MGCAARGSGGKEYGSMTERSDGGLAALDVTGKAIDRGTTRRRILGRAGLLAAVPAAALAAACGASQSAQPAAQTKLAGKLEFYDWWLPTDSPLQDNWWKFV